MISISRSGSSRSIDMNTEGQQTALDRYVKHPLQDQWTLWYLQNDHKKSWEEMLNKVTTFGTVEDFWCLYDHIKEASMLGDYNDYSVFKENIRPMWEDPGNNRGGRWIFNLNLSESNRNELDRMWLDTLLYIIGGTSKYASHITGAVVNVRHRGDRIAIWTKDCHERTIVNGIGLDFKELLNTSSTITYEMHTKSKHSKNKIMLSL